MAGLRILPVVAAAAFCFVLTGIALATDAPDFVIQGRVYCDTCRAGFETNVTEYLKGAKVRLECKHFETANVERSVNGETDETGTYKIELRGIHEEDICEVVLVGSPLSSCTEVPTGRDRARVVLSNDVGMCANLRLANPLGFLKDVPLPICGDLLKQYALFDEE